MIQRFWYTSYKICLFVLSITCFQQVAAQYYYNDLLLPQQNKDLTIYRTNKVKKINIISLGADNLPAEDFSCQIIPNANYSSTKMISKSGVTGASTLTSWYSPEGLLQKTVDSTAESITTYIYQYNADKQLTEVTNSSVSRDQKSRQDEKHTWIYNSNQPLQMQHIRNADTLTVDFVLEDEKVVEEITRKKNGQITDHVYYYYDEQRRLTDIVRFNERLQRLIPDFMFEYNEKDQLVQLVSVTRGSSDYLTWRYIYQPNGLKSEETVYDKQKQLVGKIKYAYYF